MPYIFYILNPFVFHFIKLLYVLRINKEFYKLKQKGRKGEKMAEHLNKATFLEKIFDFENNKEWKYQGNIPAVIDFWAPWCGPCRMVGPVIEELSEEYKGQVNFYKINTDEEQELAGAFGIRSIPSLLFIPVEGQPKMAVGAVPKENLKKAIQEELLTSAA